MLPISIRVNAEAAGSITLTTNTPELTGASDKEFKFDLTLKNDTAQDVTVSASATGPSDWDITTTLTGATDAASTIVKAGSTQSISVSAKPAENAPAQQYPIKVTATAGDRTIDADLSIAITGSYGMKLSTPGDVLSTRGSAGSPTTQTFQITNNGTAPITAVKLVGTPPSGWTVTVDPKDGLQSIDPQQVGSINATITPSGDAVAGDYVITFKASSTENATGSSADIRFTVETSPIWAFVGDRADRADPGGPVLRLPDLRSAMSASPGSDRVQEATRAPGATLSEPPRRAPVQQRAAPASSSRHEA